MVAPLKVGIAGLGTVGAEVVRMIEEQSRHLSARCGRGIRVVAVTARSKAKKRGVSLRGIGRRTVARGKCGGHGEDQSDLLEIHWFYSWMKVTRFWMRTTIAALPIRQSA